MTKLYIIVAESSRAKVFAFEKSSQHLKEKYDLVHTQGRHQELEINSDKPGRGKGGGVDSHHGVDSKHRSKRHESSVFTSEISKLLEAKRVDKKFDGLILIAPPQFLGELRSKLTSECKKLIVSSIDKNLVHCSNEELLSHLGSVYS